jgi:hypothetical protein
MKSEARLGLDRSRRPGTRGVVELEDGTSAQANVTIERGRTRSVLPGLRSDVGTAADAADDGGSASRLSAPVLIAGGTGSPDRRRFLFRRGIS